MHHGDEIHGEVSTSDASGGVAFTLYESGSVSARTLESDEYLVITDLSLELADAGHVVADSDAAGRRVAHLPSGHSLVQFETPYTCPRGVTPKVFTDTAVAAEVTLQGYIKKA